MTLKPPIPEGLDYITPVISEINPVYHGFDTRDVGNAYE
jgi:hypothetical protein